ncbi:sigma-70 family RNA polymerase sigma factor [Mucilaginibacter sp. BJC16-A38]|jgi:RNA polymerase sigma factor (sigma-70 family)|uniref:RNA polymerase sigma factor n=1 Tax=Mucilaginibacter phenanthrenivorans TaxID=1234842 RepID=UPI00215729D6|nr:sigma-70 family RNA polymerase sigma factor [Mucilaginibacter phenanthrenivorans]MCR8561972.1 sigma-70 family RNA polymerase sigma factor [Mucilaginibacter phenanthrenivorans]
MEAKHLQVISKFQSDLRDGLALLYDFYGKSLYQYSLRNWELDEDEAYDILYKTLETVGKVISRYEFSTEKHFTNWLFKIHKNNNLMFVRARMAKEEIEFKTVDWQQEYNEADDENEPMEFTDQFIENHGGELYDEGNAPNQLFAALEKALLTINDTDRDIVLLRMNNYSYEDIASMLGIENNQLKVRFLRTKAKIEKKTMDIIKGKLQ